MKSVQSIMILLMVYVNLWKILYFDTFLMVLIVLSCSGEPPDLVYSMKIFLTFLKVYNENVGQYVESSQTTMQNFQEDILLFANAGFHHITCSLYISIVHYKEVFLKASLSLIHLPEIRHYKGLAKL